MTIYNLLFSDLVFTLEFLGAIGTFCYIIYLLVNAPTASFTNDKGETIGFNPFINYALIGKNLLFKKSLFNQRVYER
jgi:hypothetical protein